MKSAAIRFSPLGDQAVLIQWDMNGEADIRTLHHGMETIKRAQLKGVRTLATSDHSIAVFYNPLEIAYGPLIGELERVLSRLERGGASTVRKVLHIPVVYGGDVGPDLAEVAQRTGLSEKEVVSIHSSADYLVYMLGFIVGTPYCGDLDERLVLSRRSSPRVKVEGGSIAIAGRQTIIYTVASPGGWHIIGRTPMTLFTPKTDPPFPYAAGDRIRFIPISAEEAEGWNDDRQSEWNERWNGSKL